MLEYSLFAFPEIKYTLSLSHHYVHRWQASQQVVWRQ